MHISYDECTAILDQVREVRSGPLAAFLQRHDVHGVCVIAPGTEPVIQIQVLEHAVEKLALGEPPFSTVFTYIFGHEEKLARIEITMAPPARAQGRPVNDDAARPGDPANGSWMAQFGTLGWTFYLNDVLVCMSNWHVFCAHGNNTPQNYPILLSGSPKALLYAYQPVYTRVANILDYALGKFIDPGDAADVMRPCDDGRSYPYPGRLSELGSVIANDGSQYHKVGWPQRTCRTGQLLGVCDKKVSYDFGPVCQFRHQLMFGKMTCEGDSGAVIVRESDNSVTGLACAADSTYTFANPIFLACWRRVNAPWRKDNESELPAFVGNVIPVIPPFPNSPLWPPPPLGLPAWIAELL